MEKTKLDFQAVAQRIKTVRKEAKMTQENFAEKIQYSASYVADIESTGKCSVEVLFSIAEEFKVSADWLIGLPPDKDSETEKVKAILQKASPAQRKFLEQAIIDLYQNMVENF